MTGIKGMKVTLGWDGLPTIINDDGTIYPRSAELIFHNKYYPNWPHNVWPIDPETGEKIEIEECMTGIKGMKGGGGKREGAGAPKKAATEVISFRVPAKKAKKLNTLIKKLIADYLEG